MMIARGLSNTGFAPRGENAQDDPCGGRNGQSAAKPNLRDREGSTTKWRSVRKTWEKSVDSPGGGHVRACSSLRYVVVEDMVLFLIATTLPVHAACGRFCQVCFASSFFVFPCGLASSPVHGGWPLDHSVTGWQPEERRLYI